MKLTEILSFNPSTKLPKETELPFIDMASLPTSGRSISIYTYRKWRGSGSNFRNGDTLLARITPCLENGKGGMVRGLPGYGLGHGSTEFIVMRAHEKAEENFVYYISRLPDFRSFAIQQMTGTSGRQRVNWQSLQDCEITELSASERERIGFTLGTLDDKIELNRQTNETLEALARALFKDWFVDYGPTRAKAEGREPYLPPGYWDLFPDALDDEDKPAGWEFCELQAIVELNPREPLKKGEQAPYIDMAALPTSGSISDPPISRAYSSGMRFRNGDTLLARITPCLENGKTAFVQSLPENDVGWGSTEFIVLRVRSHVPKAWTYLLARDPRFRTYAIQSMTGTSGRQRARTEAIATYPVINPTVPIWEAFGDLIGPIFDRIKAVGEESNTLAQTRDLLLPKLMSGEICFSEAERQIATVL